MLKHVQRGDQLRIAANDWNRIIDATRAHYEMQGSPRTRTGVSASHQSGIVLVKSAAGEDQPRFAVLGIDAPIILPEDNAEEFQRQVALSCVVPTEEHLHRFVILQEPLYSGGGGIGRACVSGVSLVRLLVENENDTMAEVVVGETVYLRSSSAGSCPILWTSDTTEDPQGEDDIRWAIVLLGGGGGDASQLFKVQSVANDYLACKSWDGENEGEEAIHIAKPWLLQHDVARYAQLSSLTTVDAQTVEVQTNDEIEATWKVTPAYAPGDLIQAVTRKTGVLVNDEELPLMDMNHDARAWGEVAVEGL